MERVPQKIKEYILLIAHPNKTSIPAHIRSELDRLDLQQNHWLKKIENYGKQFCRVVGTIDKIREKARQLELRCLRGISAAKLLYSSLVKT